MNIKAAILKELEEDGTDEEVRLAAEVLAREDVQWECVHAVVEFRRSTARSGATRVVMACAIRHGAPKRGWQPVFYGGRWTAERSAQAIRAAAQRIKSMVLRHGTY
jgi:hypothetical protein